MCPLNLYWSSILEQPYYLRYHLLMTDRWTRLYTLKSCLICCTLLLINFSNPCFNLHTPSRDALGLTNSWCNTISCLPRYSARWSMSIIAAQDLNRRRGDLRLGSISILINMCHCHSLFFPSSLYSLSPQTLTRLPANWEIRKEFHFPGLSSCSLLREKTSFLSSVAWFCYLGKWW